MHRWNAKKNNSSAVSEILGTVLLLGISVTLFSVVYFSILTVPNTPPIPSANIICSIADGEFVFSHIGGSELSDETKILLTIPGDTTNATIIAKDYMNATEKADGKWGVGEKVRYTYSSFVGREVDYSIVDIGSNGIVVIGFIPAVDPIRTFINDLLTCTGSSKTITASSTGTEPDNVTLWYKWNGYWEDTFDNDDTYVSAYHNMSFDQGDYVTVNRSGEGTDIVEYADNDNAAVDGLNDIGTHSNFDNLKNRPTEGTDILSESDINPCDTVFPDSHDDNTGTHSDFTAMQAGPDQDFDRLTEGEDVSSSTYTFIDEESFEGAWEPSGWSSTGRWNKESDSTPSGGGSYSADFDGGGGGGESGYLYTFSMDCSDADSITVSFWFREDCNNNDEFQIDFYTRWGWSTYEYLGTGYTNNNWNFWEVTLNEFDYLHEDFQIRFQAYYVDNNEHIYVDLVTVEKNYENQQYQMDLEVEWTNINYVNTQEQLCIYLENGSNTHSLDCSGGYMRIGDGSPDWGSQAGTISFWLKWDSLSGYTAPWGQQDNMEIYEAYDRLYFDWDGSSSLVSSSSFETGEWYFIAITWNQNTNLLSLYVGDEDTTPTLDDQETWYGSVTNRNPTGTGNTFMATYGYYSIDGHGDDLRYYDTDRSLSEIQSDYNIELNGNEQNLKSYYKFNNNFDDSGPNNNDGVGISSYSFSSDVGFGIPSGENIGVDVWHGGSWINIISNLVDGWNNVSVVSYLDSSQFTIRFNDEDDSDTDQDSWLIDCALLNLTSDPNYRLSMQVNWTGVDYSQPYEDLCIYASSLPSEYLRVDVWDGSNWQTIINALNNGWTNISVTSYLTTDTFTIRFNDTTDSDATQDTWNIGSVLLHCWEPGTGIYYEGNITSTEITKPSGISWSTFYADIDNPTDSTFSILDEDGDPISGFQNLNGNNNDISSISDDTIKLHGVFDGPVTLDSWKVNMEDSGWKEYQTDSTGSDGWSWNFNYPYSATGTYYFYSIGQKVGWPDEDSPSSPEYDTSCIHEV